MKFNSIQSDSTSPVIRIRISSMWWHSMQVNRRIWCRVMQRPVRTSHELPASWPSPRTAATSDYTPRQRGHSNDTHSSGKPRPITEESILRLLTRTLRRVFFLRCGKQGMRTVTCGVGPIQPCRNKVLVGCAGVSDG